MKSVFILVFLALLNPGLNESCKDLKTGKFYTVEPDGSRFYIERHEKFQYEKSSDGSAIRELHVKWVSDCEYYLWHSRVVKGEDRVPEFMKIDTLSIKIVEVNANSYKTISRLVNNGFEMEQEIFFE